MSKRTDIHRPQVFDPADYRVVDYIDNRRPEPPLGGGAFAWDAYKKYVAWWEKQIALHFPNWKTGAGDHKSIFQCNHCGHPGIRWVAVVEHIPTSAKLAFGDICADRVELAGRDAFRAKYIKTQAQLQQAAYEKALKLQQFSEDNPGLVDFLAAGAAAADERGQDDFLWSLNNQLLTKGELSDRQVEAAWNAKRRNEQWEARKAAEVEALKDTPPLPEGKLAIEGEIVSHKFQDSAYGTTLKMLVKLDNGNKVWGTMPESIRELQRGDYDGEGNWIEPRFPNLDALKGQRIRFNATVTRSDNDEHFGFFKRPTQAKVIA